MVENRVKKATWGLIRYACVVVAWIAILLLSSKGYEVIVMLLIPPLIAYMILLGAYRLGIIPDTSSRHQIKNDAIDIPELIQVIKNATKFVYVVAGELHHTIWNDDRIITELTAAKKTRGVDIKMIYGPDLDPEDKKLIKLAKEGIVFLYRLSDRETKHHFRINDKLDISYHSGEDRSKDRVIWFKNRSSGKLFVDFFEKKLHEANIITL